MVVHDGLLVIIVPKQMKIARFGVVRARAPARTRDESRVFAIYTHTTQDKDAYNMPTARAMITHGIIRRCPTTIPRFVGIIHRSTRANAGFGENHVNSGEVGRIFPWIGREDRAPREPVGFVAMYVPWWVRGNYWYFGAGAKFWPYRSVRGAGSKHISTTSERRR